MEQVANTDETQGYKEMLKGEIAAGKADLNKYAELSKANDSYERKTLDFVKTAPK